MRGGGCQCYGLVVCVAVDLPDVILANNIALHFGLS